MIPLFNGSLSHPVFNANQVLTDAHLNKVRDYLEAQNRATRIYLIGTGVVCGFSLELEEGAEKLILSKGAGVTSEGYLIVENEAELTHYGVAVFKESVKAEGGYPYFGKLNPEYPEVYELFTEQETEDPDVRIEERLTGEARLFSQSLTAGGDSLKTILTEGSRKMVVVLFLEIENKDLDICENDCDEAGGRRNYTLRRFLVDHRYMDRFIQFGLEPTPDLNAPYNPYGDGRLYGHYLLPEVRIHRFGYTKVPEAVDLTTIRDLEEFQVRYETVCDDTVIDDIGKAYQQAHTVFDTYFTRTFKRTNEEESEFTDLAAELKALRNTFKIEVSTGEVVTAYTPGIQYFYDFLKDLIGAYQEFRDLAFDLMEDCVPSTSRFPRHLMVGKLPVEEACLPSAYRQHFTQPPVYNGNQKRAKEITLLYERMRCLANVENFIVPAPAGVEYIRITPGQGPDALLSKRPIPYYYDKDCEVFKVWNYDLLRKCRLHEIPAYHPVPVIEEVVPEALPLKTFLLHDLDARPFLRIEGHLGLVFNEVFTKLSELRKQYNLPFDLVGLKLEGTPDEENEQYDLYFEDLEVVYDTLRKDLVCFLEDYLDLNAEGISLELTPLINSLIDFFRESGGYTDLAAFQHLDHYNDFKSRYTVLFGDYNEAGPFPSPCPVALESFDTVVASYQERAKEIRNYFLFHKYAEAHPGMEHKAGVYKGGTFILVYRGVVEELTNVDLTDSLVSTVRGEFSQDLETRGIALTGEDLSGVNTIGDFIIFLYGQDESAENDLASRIAQFIVEQENQRREIIADFCLPYRCCGGGPAINYVVEKPQPKLLIGRLEFCVDDPNVYEIAVFPAGGTVSGPGTDLNGSTWVFRPLEALSYEDRQELLANPDAESLPVTIAYTLPDGETTEQELRILPLPDASFSLYQPASNYCISGSIINLEPASPDGEITFISIIDGVEGELGIDNDARTFDPGVLADQLTTPEDTASVIIRSRRVDNNGCVGTFEIPFTVHGEPASGFIIEPAEICINGGEVLLEPGDGVELGTFTVTYNGVSLEIGSATSFDPQRLKEPPFVYDPAVTLVTITHSVQRYGCTSPTDQELTVYPEPVQDFTVPTEAVCVNGSAVEIIFNDNLETTALQAEFAGTVVNLPPDEPLFNPALLLGLFGENDTLPVTIRRTAVSEFGCPNEDTRTFEVANLSPAGFTIEGVEPGATLCIDSDPILLLPDPGVQVGQFRAFRDWNGETGTDINGIEIDATNNQYRFNPEASTLNLGLNEEVKVTIVLYTSPDEGCPNSFPLTVNYRGLPNPSFRIVAANENGAPTTQPTNHACVTPNGGPVYAFLRPNPDQAGTHSYQAAIGGTINNQLLSFNDEYGLWMLTVDHELLSSQEAEVVTITVRHTVTDEYGCTNTSQPINYRVIEEPLPSFIVEPSIGEDEYSLYFVETGPMDPNLEYAFWIYRGPTPNINQFVVEIPVEFSTLPSPAIENRPFEDANPAGLIYVELRVTRLSCTGVFGRRLNILPQATEGRIDVEATDETPRDTGLDLLRARAAGQRAALEDLGSERNLTSTKAYGMSNVFLSFMGPVEELNNRLKDTTDALIANIKRARGDRADDYRALLTLVIHNYLDKLVAEDPTDIPDTSRELLKDVMTRAKEAGVEMVNLRKAWKGKELKDNLEAKVVDKYTRLLR